MSTMLVLGQDAVHGTERTEDDVAHGRVGLARERRPHLRELDARAQTGANASPGIVDQVEPLDHREVLLHVGRQSQSQVAGVTDAMNARNTRIQLDPLEAFAHFDGGIGGVELNRLLDDVAAGSLRLDDQRIGQRLVDCSSLMN